MRYFILFLSFTLFLSSCSKDKDENTILGIVDGKPGCFPDYYLVELPNQVGQNRPYLCETSEPLITSLNCTNSVYVHLPASLAIPGKKIRFVYTEMEASCLSYSFAPRQIAIKSLKAD